MPSLWILCHLFTSCGCRRAKRSLTPPPCLFKFCISRSSAIFVYIICGSSTVFVYILRHLFTSRDRWRAKRSFTPPYLFTFSISISSAIFVYIISKSSAIFIYILRHFYITWPTRARSATILFTCDVTSVPKVIDSAAVFIYISDYDVTSRSESVCLSA